MLCIIGMYGFSPFEEVDAIAISIGVFVYFSENVIVFCCVPWNVSFPLSPIMPLFADAVYPLEVVSKSSECVICFLLS